LFVGLLTQPVVSFAQDESGKSDSSADGFVAKQTTLEWYKDSECPLETAGRFPQLTYSDFSGNCVRRGTVFLELDEKDKIPTAGAPDRTNYFAEPLGGSAVVVTEEHTADHRPVEWAGLVAASSKFLLFQHLFRLATESDTRAGLGGPFFRDYEKSILNIHGWNDGDPFFVNYIDHPMEGSVAGFLEIAHDPRYLHVEFGKNPEYWKSRLRAMAFSAVFSLQFEIGPVSEASIGNIQEVHSKTGVVDWVITPVVGMGWMLGEDALDKYLVQRWETGTQSHIKRILLRGILNPSRSFANMMQGKVPWHRDTRPGVSHF
jgi:hypothetical protein